MNFRTLTQQMIVTFSLVLAATAVSAEPLAYRLHVDGLACPFCAYGIEKKLGSLEGVQGIETHIQNGTVSIIMRDGVTLDEASAGQAVKEAGFSLRRFEQVRSAAVPSPGQGTQ